LLSHHSFQNINGEGITASVTKGDSLPAEVICGNTKLMNRYKIFEKYESIKNNVEQLEEEGKTVVILAIDDVP
jgi:cation transport ATPase